MKSLYLSESRRNSSFILFRNIAIYILTTLVIVNDCNYGAPIPYVYIPFAVAIVCIILGNGGKLCFSKIAIPSILNFFSAVLSTIIGGKTDNIMSVVVVFFCFSFMLSLIVSTPYKKSDIEFILNYYMFLSMILGMCVIVRFVQSLGGYSVDLTEVLGVHKDRNFFTAFLLPGFSYALFRGLLGKTHSAFYLLCAVVIAMGSLLTGSRAAFVTMILVALIVLGTFIRERGLGIKKIFILLVVFASVVIIYSFVSTSPMFLRLTSTDTYSSDIRVKLWTIGFQDFLQHPILGGGRGATNFATTQFDGHVAHNTFLEILGDQGIVGFGLFVWNIINILKVGKEKKKFLIPFLMACFLPRLFISDYATCGFWLMLSLCIVIATTAYTNVELPIDE